MATGLRAPAAPPLSTIEDVLYKADGTKFSGVVFIEWKTFQAADKSTIATQSLAVPIQDGVLRVRLVPTTNATPAAYYSVRYHSDGRVQFAETWAVPPSSTVLRLRDVRVLSLSQQTGTIQPPAQQTEIQESDVVGLLEDLEIRPVKGPGYAASRVAFINETGALEAVMGSVTDCVRVDGTAGPCGTGSGGPGFVDGETPAGPVDGTNTVFSLNNIPSPPASLALYRNGMRQKEGLDYTLSGNVITFNSASTPQPGDVLVCSYRLADASNPAGAAGGALSGTYPNPSIAQGVITDYNIADTAQIRESKLALNYPTHSSANDPTPGQKAALAGTAGIPSATNRYVTEEDPRLGNNRSPQVICSATGGSTSSTTLTELGACAIPAGTLAAGDRVVVSFGYTHEGTTQAPAFELRWGETTVVSRSSSSSELRLVGHAEFGLYEGGALWSAQSWGSSLSLAYGSGIATDSFGSTINIRLLGRFTSDTTNTLTLRNFTVIRYPAQAGQ